MKQFFVTIWLRSGDSKKDVKIFSEKVREIASSMQIQMDDAINVSSGGNRITIRGNIEQDDAAGVLERLAGAVTEQIQRQAKGRLMS